ncbi:PAS domain S-box protein [Brasilonema sp. UFV-L1]|uniref:PAS domain S-box protein n=2 Tax=Brasilonema sp. UFV-L1 TaxID=2234130 RepID=UPI0032B70FB1
MNIDKLEIDKFTKRVQGMHRRLTDLYDNLNTVPVMPNVLPQALVELGSASEIVHIATEELRQQNEELLQTRSLLETERQRYQDLFEFAPDAYLVTNTSGIIREANRTAAILLDISQHHLIGKPMTNFVALPDRQSFRAHLIQLSESNKVKELIVHIQKRNGELFDAAMTVGVVRNQERQPIALRWLIRDITERKQVELAVLKNDCDLSQNRLWHKCSKGDFIPLKPGIIWYVCQGCVKLTTLCETGEEVIVGLAGEGMVFGSSLTGLHTYQATALSNVELVSIHLAEIAASPMLSYTLLPKINQRLQQTESFLLIAGRRRVQDRFHQLLVLLQQEIGQAVEQGTRLSIRLTHEELASACCTTRVTITRLIGQLQQQGKISFDSRHHIIIKNL